MRRFFFLLLALGVALSPAGARAADKAADGKALPRSYIGEMKTHTARHEDTLVHLARANNLGFVDIRAANPGLDPWLPGEGAEVVLPTMYLLPDLPEGERREGIVINLPEMRLYYFPKEKDAPPVSFPIGIGREGFSSPTGKTSVVRKTARPTWRPTARMRKDDPDLPATVPPGPDNPLGTHALYLGWPTYAIHGTNRPFGIGRRVSSGCIRLYPEDIIELFRLVDTGTPVHVVDQPIKAAWAGNTLYVEAHPSQDEVSQMEREGRVESFHISEETMRTILGKAGRHARNIDWEALREAVRARAGYPVAIAERK